MTAVNWSELREAAARAADRSYSPYSSFPVGAAGLVADGSVLTATNVENASFAVGICAETALVGVVIASGHGRGDLVAVAIAGPGGADLAPCGRCRQLLHEIGAAHLLVNERPISEWLPDAFGPDDLR